MMTVNVITIIMSELLCLGLSYFRLNLFLIFFVTKKSSRGKVVDAVRKRNALANRRNLIDIYMSTCNAVVSSRVPSFGFYIVTLCWFEEPSCNKNFYFMLNNVYARWNGKTSSFFFPSETKSAK